MRQIIRCRVKDTFRQSQIKHDTFKKRKEITKPMCYIQVDEVCSVNFEAY